MIWIWISCRALQLSRDADDSATYTQCEVTEKKDRALRIHTNHRVTTADVKMVLPKHHETIATC